MGLFDHDPISAGSYSLPGLEPGGQSAQEGRMDRGCIQKGADPVRDGSTGPAVLRLVG